MIKKAKDICKQLPPRPDTADKISESQVDESIIETFPASDPPAWTLGLDPDRKGKTKIRDGPHRRASHKNKRA